MGDTGTLKSLEAVAARLKKELDDNPVFVEYETVNAAIVAIREAHGKITNGAGASHVAMNGQTVKVTRPESKRRGQNTDLKGTIPIILQREGKALGVAELVALLSDAGEPLSAALKDATKRLPYLESWVKGIGTRHGVCLVPGPRGETLFDLKDRVADAKTRS